MIFDTDIFIWVQRGNEKAARLMEKTPSRFLSIQTYMELLQGARNKSQHKTVKDFLSSNHFIILIIFSVTSVFSLAKNSRR